jgi:hypothetical protein
MKILEGLLLTTLTISVMFCIVGFAHEIAGDEYNATLVQSYNETTGISNIITDKTDFC